MYNRERTNVRRTQRWSWLNPLERGAAYVNFSSVVPYVFIWDVYSCFVDVYRQKEIDHPLSLDNL